MGIVVSRMELNEGQKHAVKELQELVDQIVKDNTQPYISYLKGHSLGLIDSKLAIIDKALDMGLVTIND